MQLGDWAIPAKRNLCFILLQFTVGAGSVKVLEREQSSGSLIALVYYEIDIQRAHLHFFFLAKSSL